MKHFFESIPIPICGVMLGIVSLGNLLNVVFSKLLNLAGLGYLILTFCGIITFLLLVLMLLKVVFSFKMCMEMLKNPEIAGIFSAYTLTLMIFAGYLPEYVGFTAAEIIWWVGVLMHYTNMVIFTYRFVIEDFKLPALLPPWYIVYVGFALSGFSSANFAPSWFGIASFFIGFISFWVIFVMLIKRNQIEPIPRMFEPTICINAAIGICLTTYLRNFKEPWFILITFMYFTSLAIWIWIIFKLPKLLKLPFYPSDAAFSFPFVVSAIASLETQMFLGKQGFFIDAWNTPIIIIQTIVAVLMVGLTVYRFIKHIYESLKEKSPQMRMMKMNMINNARNMNGKREISLKT